MKAARIVSPFILSAMLAAQSASPVSTPEAGNVMIVGVAHDSSVMGGGISSSNYLPKGKVYVEPIAFVTPDGEWRKLSCDDVRSSGYSKACKKFDRDYLSKPHDYAVVSADGLGAIVHVNRMSLDHECFGIYGHGTFTGADIRYAAVASESGDIFTTAPPASRLPEAEAEPVRKAFAAAVGDKLDTTDELRVYAVKLEGQSLLVIQRAFQQYADKPEYRSPGGPRLDFIFAVGRMEDEKFHLLFSKENAEDENEQILGLVHLKSGRDFLVNTESEPEGDQFRIYGIQNGRFVLIFKGGGGEC
jgi:hypothetical protein